MSLDMHLLHLSDSHVPRADKPQEKQKEEQGKVQSTVSQNCYRVVEEKLPFHNWLQANSPLKPTSSPEQYHFSLLSVCCFIVVIFLLAFKMFCFA